MTPTPPRVLQSRLVPLATVAFAALFLCAGLGRAGVWEGELANAEWARQLTSGRPPEGPPSDVSPRVGALAFWTIGLGLRVFGLGAASGRLGSCVCCLAAVAALYGLLARFFDRRTGVYGALALTTCPLVFEQARSMVGDAVPIASFAIALCGLAVATLSPGESLLARGAYLALGALGCLAGATSAGVATGVALPLLSIGVAWLLVRLSRATPDDAPRDLRGRLALVAGVVASALAILAILATKRGAPRAISFDVALTAIAHAAFPWSALAPFAFADAVDGSDASAPRASVGRAVAAVALVLGLVTHTFLVATQGDRPFVAIAAVAAVVAISLRRLDRTDALPLVRASGIAVLAWLLARDFGRIPEKVLAPFALDARAVPSLLSAAAGRAWFTVAALTLLGAAGAISCGALRRIGVRAGLALACAGAIGGSLLRFGFYPTLTARLSPQRAFERYVVLRRSGEPVAVFAIDARTAAYSGAGVPTSLPSFDDVASAHGWLTSPGPRRFLVVRRRELAPLNARFRASSGAPANVPIAFDDGGEALLASDTRLDGEPELNPLERVVLPSPPASLAYPIGARLGDGAAELEVVGWQPFDARGRPLALEELSTGAPFHARVYYRVLAPFSGTAGYCTFFHVDGAPARFATEHKDWAEYPLSLWRAGDVLVDDFEVTLPRSFRAGEHPVWLGFGQLPCTDDRRMRALAGANDGHGRISAGVLRGVR